MQGISFLFAIVALIQNFYINTLFIYQFLILQMSINRQLQSSQSTLCLIEWMNLQRINAGKQGHLYTFSQIYSDNSIFELLTQIDPVFAQFASAELSQKFSIIEKYLDKQFGKRMKWAFKQSLGDLSSEIHIQELVKLICYFSIHSKMKNEVINRILSLSEEAQKFLMDHMKYIQIKLQNITEIKDILDLLEILERENEQLKEKLQQMTHTNFKLLQMIKDSQSQRKSTKLQAQKLRLEKCEVFDNLRINYITEYLDAYNRIKGENEKNYEVIKQNERKIQIYSGQIKQLEERIKCDCVVINSLGDQITRLKDQLVKKVSWQKQKENTENIKILKEKRKENLQIKEQILNQMRNPLQKIADNKQKQIYRIESEQAKTMLGVMHNKYNKLTKEATQLREQKQKLLKRNTFLESIFKEIQQEHLQFQFSYGVIKKEGQLLLSSVCSSI